MGPTRSPLDPPPPPPPPPSYTLDPQYVPAPHLTSDSFLSNEDLIYYYKDFYASLKYIQAAPELVYERFVANFNTAVKAARERDPGDAPIATTEACNDGADDQLKAEIVQLKSTISAMQLDRQQQVETLENYKKEYITLRSSEDRLKAGVKVLGSKISAMGLERQQQLDTLQKYRSENEILQSSNDSLNVELELLKSKISALVLENQQQANMLRNCRNENTSLQSSNHSLGAEVEALKLAISVQAIDLQDYNEQKGTPKSPNSESKEMAYLRPNVKADNPTIGIFHHNEAQPRDDSSPSKKILISFTKAYPAPPTLALGITSLHTTGNNGAPKPRPQNTMSITFYAHDIQREGFEVDINSYTHNAGCTWLEIKPKDLDFQCSSFTTQNGNGKGSWATFPKPYTKPPQVVLWLKSFSSDSDNWRLHTYATEISTVGFKVHVESWGGSTFKYAVVSWVAFTADKVGVFSGNVQTSPCKSQHRNEGRVSFEETFSTPPRVIMAISKIDIKSSRSLHVSLKTSDITVSGMTWHVDGMSDTFPNSIGASFIALS